MTVKDDIHKMDLPEQIEWVLDHYLIISSPKNGFDDFQNIVHGILKNATSTIRKQNELISELERRLMRVE